MQFCTLPILKAFLHRNHKDLGPTANLVTFSNEDVDLFYLHNERVHRIVPKDRLLEFDPKSGYEALCQFLDVPVPTDEQGNTLPYPHVNDTKSLSLFFKSQAVLGAMLWAAVATGGYFAVREYASPVRDFVMSYQ